MLISFAVGSFLQMGAFSLGVAELPRSSFLGLEPIRMHPGPRLFYGS